MIEREDLQKQIGFLVAEREKAILEFKNCESFLLKVEGALEVLRSLISKFPVPEASEVLSDALGADVEVLGIEDAPERKED